MSGWVLSAAPAFGVPEPPPPRPPRPARQGLWPRPVASRRTGDGAARREGDRPQRLRAEHGCPHSLRVGGLPGRIPADAQGAVAVRLNDAALVRLSVSGVRG